MLTMKPNENALDPRPSLCEEVRPRVLLRSGKACPPVSSIFLVDRYLPQGPPICLCCPSVYVDRIIQVPVELCEVSHIGKRRRGVGAPKRDIAGLHGPDRAPHSRGAGPAEGFRHAPSRVSLMTCVF